MIQFIKFGIVGVSNTLINIAIYNLLRIFNVDPNVANSIGYIFGTINSYIWNRNWVFSSKESQRKLITKFIIVNLITLGFNNTALWLLVKAGINDRIGQLIATAFGMVLNYVMNKLWTFKGDAK